MKANDLPVKLQAEVLNTSNLEKLVKKKPWVIDIAAHALQEI